jgi:transcriptional regulator with XRE-family HTH domain
MSLESFCKEHGFSLGYLSDIENGKRLPTIEMLDRIARALNIRIRDFF